MTSKKSYKQVSSSLSEYLKSLEELFRERLLVLNHRRGIFISHEPVLKSLTQVWESVELAPQFPRI